MAFNASIGANLSQGYSSAASAGQSNSTAGSYSQTNATAAREWSAEQARIAFERQKELMAQEQTFNAQQAKIARDWEESMANSVYTRSVANMKEAGINPILAANMGLSAAAVGSGATASASGAAAPMAQGFMDTSSASSSQSNSSEWSKSSSEEGIVTAMKALGDMAASALNGMNSANTLNLAIDMGEKAADKVKGFAKSGIQKAVDVVKDVKQKVKDVFSVKKGGGHNF